MKMLSNIVDTTVVPTDGGPTSRESPNATEKCNSKMTEMKTRCRTVSMFVYCANYKNENELKFATAYIDSGPTTTPWC